MIDQLFNLRGVVAALIVGLLMGGAGAGYVVHKMDRADYAALELSVADAKDKAKDAAAAKAEADRKAGDAIAAKEAADARLASYEFNQIRKGAYDVKTSLRSRGLPDYVLPAGWVREYNAAMSAGTGQASAAAGAAAGAPSGAGAAQAQEDADAQPSGINQWDVLDNAIDNAEGYASCRRQLNRLIDWALATSDP